MKIGDMLKLFGIVLVLSIAGNLLIGCDGPQGPEGPEGLTGPTGPEGLAASGQCGTCHNVSTVILAKQIQYQGSKHFLGTTYLRGTSATCAPCHSNEGFRMKIAGQAVTGISDPTPVNCRTCHNIHTDYAATDFALSTAEAVTLTGIMTTNAVINIGKGNLCANCHQSRPQNYNLTVGGPDVLINSTHWGPHNATQANILTGNGGFEIRGSLSYGNSGHTTVVEDGCVTCHLTSHTFKPSLTTCKACHPSITSFDNNGVQTEITGLLNELQDKLLAAGILEEADGEYEPVAGNTIPSAQAGALLNYLYIEKDKSLGVHNTNYTRALLQNSIEVF